MKADDNRTAFLMAVAAGRVESARFFLESGADVRACTSEMKNCVHLAVENGHLEMVELLLKNTEVTENLYRSDAWERVPLHNAAISPNIKVSNLLLLLRIRSAHLGMCLLIQSRSQSPPVMWALGTRVLLIQRYFLHGF